MVDLTPLVFVHGLSGPLDNAAIRMALHPRIMFAPDLLGYGACSELHWTTLTFAAQVEHLRQDIGVRFAHQSVHLVAHSVGGIIACLLAHRYPERIASIICFEGCFARNPNAKLLRTAHMDRDRRKSALNKLAANPVSWLVSAGILSHRHDTTRAIKWLARQPASSLLSTALSMTEATRSQEYAQLLREVFSKHPVHLVTGNPSQGDWEVPEWILDLAESVIVVPGIRHPLTEYPLNSAHVIAKILAASDAASDRLEM